METIYMILEKFMEAAVHASLKIFSFSLSGSFVILCVLLLSLALRRAPKRYLCLLWSIAGIRLVCPVTLPLLELLPVRTDAFVYENLAYGFPRVQTGMGGVDAMVNAVLLAAAPPAHESSVNPMQILMLEGALLWMLGIALMVTAQAVRYFRWRRRLRTAVRTQEPDVYETDQVSGPILFGVVKPRIYVPASMEEKDRYYAVLHERAHRQGGDHLIKLLAWLILTVHWFNPLVWLAFRRLTLDMEMRCDERVLSGLDLQARASYGQVLLNMAGKRGSMGAMGALGFGESVTGRRIKNILKYKKPAIVVSALCILVLLAAGAVLLSGSSEEGEDPGMTVSADGPATVWVAAKVEDGTDEYEITTDPAVSQQTLSNLQESITRRIEEEERLLQELEQQLAERQMQMQGLEEQSAERQMHVMEHQVMEYQLEARMVETHMEEAQILEEQQEALMAEIEQQRMLLEAVRQLLEMEE